MSGAAAIVRGTMAATVPMEEPTIKRVNGMMATNRMMNGVERTAFTMVPIMRLTYGLGMMPLGDVTNRKTPKGIPIAAPSPPLTPTIRMVSRKDSQRRLMMLDDICELLDANASFGDVVQCLSEVFCGSFHHDRECAVAFALNLINLS